MAGLIQHIKHMWIAEKLTHHVMGIKSHLILLGRYKRAETKGATF